MNKSRCDTKFGKIVTELKSNSETTHEVLNTIEGLNLEVIDNGIYSQPELVGENVRIHIYHKSNRLNSKLVKERIDSDKPFFCIRFDVDKTHHLKSIEAVHPASGEKESLYNVQNVVKLAG